ncbi:MAG: flagellar hook capping FlgD N-terminal domain-containing protein [Bacillota bacterium]|jgi:flagellar basal-body rod modification protein FlgD
MRVEESSLYYNDREVRQPKQVLDKDAFMQILVTQLRYQDPSQPQDTEAFIAQMSQFTMLEQMFNMNENLESLIKSSLTSQVLELIGKEVKVPAGEDEVITGFVESVNLAGSEPQLLVGGKYYSPDMVFQVNKTPDPAGDILSEMAKDLKSIAEIMVPLETGAEKPGEAGDE